MVMCLSRRGSSAGKQQCKGSSKKELCHSLMCWFADKDPHWKRRFKKPTAYRTHYAGGRCALLPPQRIGIKNFLSAASGWRRGNHFHLKAAVALYFSGFQGCRIDLRSLGFRDNNDRLGVCALHWFLLLRRLRSGQEASGKQQRDYQDGMFHFRFFYLLAPKNHTKNKSEKHFAALSASKNGMGFTASGVGSSPNGFQRFLCL